MSTDDLRVMFFCLGNICRSPLAEALFSHKIEERELDDVIHVESSGTSAYHVGESPDPGSQNVARERLGRDISHQRSQQLSVQHLEEFDYLVAMDRSNKQRALDRARGDIADKLFLLREFEPRSTTETDVPDPYGAGQSQFGLVYDIVDRCTDEFLAFLMREHPNLDGA